MIPIQMNRKASLFLGYINDLLFLVDVQVNDYFNCFIVKGEDI